MKRLNTNLKTIPNFIKPSRKLSVLLFDATMVWLLLAETTDSFLKPQDYIPNEIIWIEFFIMVFFVFVYPFIVILEIKRRKSK